MMNMENEKLFELMTQMYSELREVKTDVKSLKKTVLNIEQDHGKKLEALFDGYKQNTEQLTRIEEEVKKQDEVILRRIK